MLTHLLHPNTLQRLTDTQTYGGQYSVYEMLDTLTEGVFASDLASNVNSYRQNLQVEYVQMLTAAMGSEANGHNVRSAIFGQLRALAQAMETKIGSADFMALNGATRAHSHYIEYHLGKALAVTAQ